MKLLSIALLFAAFFSAPLRAAVSPIHMDVEQHSATKQPQAKPGHHAQGASTQHHSLTIRLSNNSADAFDRLVVKYFFLGHDLKDHNVTVLKQGERKSSLSPRGNDTVESEEFTNTFAEAHTDLARGRGRSYGNGRRNAKRVAASGKKFTGYAVQVINGGKVEAEFYSEESYRDKVKAAAPSLADQPAKKASSKKKK